MGLFGKKQAEVDPQEEKVEVPVEEPKPEKPKTTTIIGEGITVTGDFNANENICILGTVKGNVVSEYDLKIAETGKLLGNANVAKLESDGIIIGEIHVDGNAKLGEHSLFTGILDTNTFVADAGARFDGQLKLGIKKVEEPEVPAPAEPADPTDPAEEKAPEA